jgi:hypothetical protein
VKEGQKMHARTPQRLQKLNDLMASNWLFMALTHPVVVLVK